MYHVSKKHDVKMLYGTWVSTSDTIAGDSISRTEWSFKKDGKIIVNAYWGIDSFQLSGAYQYRNDTISIYYSHEGETEKDVVTKLNDKELQWYFIMATGAKGSTSEFRKVSH